MQQTVQRVAVDGAELKVMVQGSGEPVVFVHGAVVADDFEPTAAEPVLRDHQLIRYHRRGYAGSAGVPGSESVERDASDCRAVLAGLGLERVQAVGHSYGGAVVLQLAVDAPDLVHSLALLEPAMLGVPSAAQLDEVFAPIRQAYSTGDTAAAVDGFMRLFCGPSWRDWIERRVPGGAAQAERDAVPTFESDVPALQTWQFGADQARKIQAPVLLVTGAASGTMFQEIRDLARVLLPQTEDVVLPDANHAFTMTHPQELAAVLATFLRRHPVASASRTDSVHATMSPERPR
jgi:3-oxoadipate enol-lactonase